MLFVERLGYEGHVGGPFRQRAGIRITGNNHGGPARAQIARKSDHVEARNHRHREIGHDNIETVRLTLDDGQGLGAAGGCRNLKSVLA